jgi:oxepin-CoA hydrolase/3-oxo-5,6-dehydrosuberyl-CoA semialdehyde dehydrogenase
MTPIYPAIRCGCELTDQSKRSATRRKGEVRWAVSVFNQKDEVVATYDL